MFSRLASSACTLATEGSGNGVACASLWMTATIGGALSSRARCTTTVISKTVAATAPSPANAPNRQPANHSRNRSCKDARITRGSAAMDCDGINRDSSIMCRRHEMQAAKCSSYVVSARWLNACSRYALAVSGSNSLHTATLVAPCTCLFSSASNSGSKLFPFMSNAILAQSLNRSASLHAANECCDNA